MRTRWLLLAALLLTACGDDGATEPPLTRTASPPAASPSPSPSPSPTTLAVRLTGDGIDTAAGLVAFGDAFEQAAPKLRAALGEPTLDTGEQESFGKYGTCPGSRLRALEYGDGALHVLFGDVIGPGLTMYQWTLTGQGRPADVPQASALVGDVTTFEFGVGDTVGELREGTPGSQLELREGDEILRPSFALADQSAGFFGFLTGIDDSDTVTAVQAGQACGE